MAAASDIRRGQGSAPGEPGVELVRSRERFDELAEPWDDLADLDGTPFLRHAWLGAWADAFAAGRELRTLVLWDGDRIAAAMPMVGTDREWVGMANPAHSPLIRPLARDRDSGRELTRRLFAAPAGLLRLSCVPEDDAPTLAAEARDAGRLVHRSAELTSPIVDTNGDFEAWRTETKPRWRTPIERLRRKMHRDHDARFELFSTPDKVDEVFEQGLELESAGWKGRDGTAILSTPETTRFYRSVANAFAARGELCLSSITLDGRLVAFDYCLLDDRRLYIIKTTFDESLRRLAPGLVLRLSAIERCFELGLEALEFLGASDDYKLKFSTSERRHFGMRCYRRRPGPLIKYGYQSALRPRLRSAYHAARDRVPSNLGRRSEESS
jgi:CelD/BcsL family acetyltransferase involved in cellulose biosynthesis